METWRVSLWISPFISGVESSFNQIIYWSIGAFQHWIFNFYLLKNQTIIWRIFCNKMKWIVCVQKTNEKQGGLWFMFHNYRFLRAFNNPPNIVYKKYCKSVYVRACVLNSLIFFKLKNMQLKFNKSLYKFN